MNQKLKITPNEQRILDQLADCDDFSLELLGELGIHDPMETLEKLTLLGMIRLESVQVRRAFDESTGKWVYKPQVNIEINQNFNKENITYERNYTRNETN